MTKPATATQARIRRHVKAAYEAGAKAIAIRPDGLVVAYMSDDHPLIPALDHVGKSLESERIIVL